MSYLVGIVRCCEHKNESSVYVNNVFTKLYILT